MTSMGLNNFGKQVYRYGLEDIDFDTAGQEVFRQSDSTFFCRIRDLFGTELKQMYQDLESKDAWKASTLINECDAWQDEFPEELWRVDIERKYIRTYNSSFINGKGDAQFLTNMANGKMKYHRRQWERNQEQYMASKYQTTTALGDDHHANFRVNRFESTSDLVVAPNYQFTLTPYAYMYLNVQYGGTTPISVRVTRPNVPTVVPYAGTSADIINVGSAASITDFGDLSALYPDTVSVQNATRVKTLKVGNSTPGYTNSGFSSLTTGSNGLLEELDITNISSFASTLDLKKLINLKKLCAFGTSIPSVIFAEGSKINYVELPAVNDIILKNLNYLPSSGLKLSSYANVVELSVEACPLIDQLSLFESCANLNRAKLDNINFGTKTYSYFEDKIFKLAGTDASSANAQLAGSVHFESLTGAEFNELKTRYPKLVITYDTLVSTIVFKDSDLESVVYETTISGIGNCDDPVNDLGKEAPTKDATQEFTYSLFGWSDVANTIVDYNDLSTSEAEAAESADRKKYNEDVLTNIEGDRVFYPVFKATRKKYNVYFMNPSESGDILLQTVSTPYGKDAKYTGATPVKQDTVHATLYEHYGWYPSTENILEDRICYAQFSPLDQHGQGGIDDGDTLPGYTIGWLDISDCPKYSYVDGKYTIVGYYDGYTLDNNNKTMAITECINEFNTVILIPEELRLNGNTYAVTSLGGFSGNTVLKLIILPDSLAKISDNCFSGCSNLSDISLPSSLYSIGANAFNGCTKLNKILIPASVTSISEAAFSGSKLNRIEVAADSVSYKVDSNCLIEISTNKLIQGLTNSVIPNYVQSLGKYCFAGSSIKNVTIPYGVSVIPSNAFANCSKLTNITLPETIETLDATCFNGCSSLTNITLPEGLFNINTYVFNSCALSAVEIPSTVNEVRENAFGNMTSLKTVTFKKCIDSFGNVVIPNIHAKAFINSGAITFNLPWSEEQHYNNFANNPTFGAKAGSILNFAS